MTVTRADDDARLRHHGRETTVDHAAAFIWLFSVTDKSKRAAIDRAGFLAQQARSETGIGAAVVSAH